MTEFTPLMSFAGGLLIGLSALLLMLTWGRIAGMTAIIGGILPPLGADWSWKAAFLAGAILAPFALSMSGYTVEYAVPVSTTALVVGGLIAGIGVTFGSGCTSGHGRHTVPDPSIACRPALSSAAEPCAVQTAMEASQRAAEASMWSSS